MLWDYVVSGHSPFSYAQLTRQSVAVGCNAVSGQLIFDQLPEQVGDGHAVFTGCHLQCGDSAGIPLFLNSSRPPSQKAPGRARPEVASSAWPHSALMLRRSPYRITDADELPRRDANRHRPTHQSLYRRGHLASTAPAPVRPHLSPPARGAEQRRRPPFSPFRFPADQSSASPDRSRVHDTFCAYGIRASMTRLRLCPVRRPGEDGFNGKHLGWMEL